MKGPYECRKTCIVHSIAYIQYVYGRHWHTETHRNTQKHTETHGNTKPDRNRQRQTETDRDGQRQTETDTSIEYSGRTHMCIYTFVVPHYLTLHAALKYLAVEYTTGLLSTLIRLASSLSLCNFKESNIFMPLVRRLFIVITISMHFEHDEHCIVPLLPLAPRS